MIKWKKYLKKCKFGYEFLKTKYKNEDKKQ